MDEPTRESSPQMNRLEQRLMQGFVPEVVRKAQEFAARTMEGANLIKQAMGHLSAERQAEAQRDLVGKKLEVHMETSGMESILVTLLQDKKPTQEQRERIDRVLSRTEEAPPPMTPLEMAALAKQILESRDARNEARGAIPLSLATVEGRLSDRLENGEVIELAAGLQIIETLDQAVSGGKLNAESLRDAKRNVKTMVAGRVEAAVAVAALEVSLTLRHPDQSGQIGKAAKDIGESWNRERNDVAVRVPEASELDDKEVARRAVELVQSAGLVRKENQAKLLERMGVKQTGEENGEPVYEVAEDSRARKLFEARDDSARKAEGLKGALEYGKEHPRAAGEVLEVAYSAHQAKQAERINEARMAKLITAAKEAEEHQVQEEMARAKADEEKVKAEQAKRVQWEQRYQKAAGMVVEGVGALDSAKKKATEAVVSAAKWVHENTFGRLGGWIRKVAEGVDAKVGESFSSTAADQAKQAESVQDRIAKLQQELALLQGKGPDGGEV